jgi:hypothetical protein
MSNAVHELAEKIEHLSHEAHGGHGGHDSGKASGKHIGITMAVLGVMLAVSSAMVGGQRTELIATMVQQSNRLGLYQSETTKFRVVEADVEMLKSISPKPDEIKKVEETLRAKRAPSGRVDDEDTAELKDLIASATEDMADLLTPDPEEVHRFQKLARKYERDMKDAKEDAEAYDGAIEAHQEAAESYEWAQLAAEVGIVVASIALLLSNRAIWLAAVALGLGCAGTLGVTFAHTKAEVSRAEEKIRAASENVVKLEADDEDDDPGATEAKGGDAKREETKGGAPGAEPKGAAPRPAAAPKKE